MECNPGSVDFLRIRRGTDVLGQDEKNIGVIGDIGRYTQSDFHCACNRGFFTGYHRFASYSRGNHQYCFNDAPRAGQFGSADLS